MTYAIMVHLIKPQKQPQISDKNFAFLTAKNNMSKSRGKNKQKGEQQPKPDFQTNSRGY
jgi:hypothetical protein